jgi:hypothetical protein
MGLFYSAFPNPAILYGKNTGFSSHSLRDPLSLLCLFAEITFSNTIASVLIDMG